MRDVAAGAKQFDCESKAEHADYAVAQGLEGDGGVMAT